MKGSEMQSKIAFINSPAHAHVPSCMQSRALCGQWGCVCTEPEPLRGQGEEHCSEGGRLLFILLRWMLKQP